MLHHGFGCAQMWKDIYPALEKAGYCVIMYDRRGYGRSEGGPDFEDFYVSDGFNDAMRRETAAFLDFLGLDAVHLVGQCEGGVAAAWFAAAHPDRVRTVVLASTLYASPRPLPELNREAFHKSFDELDEPLRRKLMDWHGPDRARPFFEMFRVMGGAYGCGYFKLRPTLERIQAPALVLYPDRSFLFEVEQGVAMYRALPQGELAVIPSCGHNSYEQAPDDYSAAVLGFLERHGF